MRFIYSKCSISARCRSCQFHSCLTWLHKNDSNAKRPKPLAENTTQSHLYYKKRKHYIQIIKNVIHMWYSVKSRHEITWWTLSISRMADQLNEKNQQYQRASDEELWDIQKCVCFIVWCVDLSHTHFLNWFDGCSQWKKRWNPFQRSKLVTSDMMLWLMAIGLELHSRMTISNWCVPVQFGFMNDQNNNVLWVELLLPRSIEFNQSRSKKKTTDAYFFPFT